MNKKDNQIPFFLPYGNQPKADEKEYSNFEPIYKFDSSINNIVLTDETRNIQIEIDAYLDGTRIYDILDKYLGVQSVENLSSIQELNVRQGHYMDISELPTNLHELKQLGEKISAKIQELNTNDRVNFENSNKDISNGSELNNSESTKKEFKASQKNTKENEKGE